METPELKPCPFCGSPDVRTVRALSPRGRSVYCGQCEAEGPHGRSDGKAVELWNAALRAEVKAEVAKTERVECGHPVQYLCGQCGASICDDCLIQDGKRTCVKCPTEKKRATNAA